MTKEIKMNKNKNAKPTIEIESPVWHETQEVIQGKILF